ncbi:MAG TPA: hypothetical protein VNQ74_07815, partial [Burkholderiaceae bacterium]|nr:hypothetical protein [Burkholderiaceae bacterium]
AAVESRLIMITPGFAEIFGAAYCSSSPFQIRGSLCIDGRTQPAIEFTRLRRSPVTNSPVRRAALLRSSTTMTKPG